MKPPSLEMLTPNGRFKPQTKLCLSFTDFHPESWNPLWGPSTLLLGLQSFMLESSSTYGSITVGVESKRRFAKESLEFNVKNTTFCTLFPDLVDLYKKQKEDEEKRRKEIDIDKSNGDNSSDHGASSNVNSFESLNDLKSSLKENLLFLSIITLVIIIFLLKYDLFNYHININDNNNTYFITWFKLMKLTDDAMEDKEGSTSISHDEIL